MRDITSLKRSHERLMHDAVHDSLTSLPNRELFLDRLQGAITRAREGQMNRPTVMFIDVDRFKNVNKSFGLAVGDSMLLTLGRRLSRHLNPQDTLARLGSDQFAILMISETDPRQVATLAERVRRALRTPMKIGGKEIVLTASIGIVVDDGVQPTAQDLLREGEIAMLRAKRAGADRIEIFTASMRGEEESRLPLESDLRKALEKRQIAVLYQPITRLASNQLAGFEALIRWDHPTRGQLSPDEFVPIAEETGLIGELGSYVLGQALEEAGRWHKVLPRERDPLFVSVNVSSRQLFRQDLVQEIRLILAKEAVPKGTLKLEITESLVMENPERAVEILSWLKAFGASLALDDFGTGYCSLSYLHRFPCDTIKVDRSLVRDSGLNGSTPMILRSIVALSHELGKEVIAEGVETAEDAAYLRSIGCEYGQGFYYGEPMTPKEVADLLSALASHRKRQQRERSKAAARGHVAPAQVARPVAQAAPPRPKPAASGVS
jgi:diguanylate cyclase (GGDEF)-like protein